MRKFALAVAINLVAILAAVLAYYAYGKVSYENYFCGSFGQIDPEIGWVLAPSASSCIGGRPAFSSGPSWFEGKVFTDANGFRSQAPGTPTPSGGIMTVGDSWTFGYGVDFADSFPGRLQKLTGVPVVVAASPAYSSAQAIMLGERWVERLRPRAIVYFDAGVWDRAACSGSRRPQAILKPCYWQAPGADVATLIVPPPGRIAAYAPWGVLPGGMLGAGEDGWAYFVVSRPVALGYQMMARAGIVPGFGHDFRAVGVDAAAIRRGVADHLARFAAQAQVPLLFLDPHDAYAQAFASLSPERKTNIHHVGRDTWQPSVEEPAKKLPPNVAKIPHDDHFGPGTAELVATLIRSRLQALGVAM